MKNEKKKKGPKVKRDKKGLWLPGETPNPKGRPKKEETYSDTLKELLQGQDICVTWKVNGKEKAFNVSSDKNFYYGIAAAQIMEALEGNIQAQKEIVDRVQGKSTQFIVAKDETDTTAKFRRIAELMDARCRPGGDKPDNGDPTQVSS